MNGNKHPYGKLYSFSNQLNLALDENISMENKSLSFTPIINEPN